MMLVETVDVGQSEYMVRDMDGGQDMFCLLEQSDLIVMNKCDATHSPSRGALTDAVVVR